MNFDFPISGWRGDWEKMVFGADQDFGKGLLGLRGRKMLAQRVTEVSGEAESIE